MLSQTANPPDTTIKYGAIRVMNNQHGRAGHPRKAHSPRAFNNRGTVAGYFTDSHSKTLKGWLLTSQGAAARVQGFR
jgi:hypothetical protein